MQAGFPRLFGRRERDEKEELPLEFSLRILLNPRMLSCSLNLLQCQFDGAASIAALLGCAAAMCGGRWVGDGQANFSSHKEEGLQLLARSRLSLLNPRHKKGQGAGAVGACSTDVLLNISSFWGCRVRPDLFLLRALPAADCDTKLLLSSSVLSSELSRRSLAYPGPTNINLARSA